MLEFMCIFTQDLMMCFGRAMRDFVLPPPPSVPLPSSPPLQNKNHHCTGKTHSLQKTTAIRISSPFWIILHTNIIKNKYVKVRRLIFSLNFRKWRFRRIMWNTSRSTNVPNVPPALPEENLQKPFLAYVFAIVSSLIDLQKWYAPFWNRQTMLKK